MKTHTTRLLPLLFSAALSIVTLSSCSEHAQMPGRSFEGTITEVIQVPGIGDMMAAKDSSGGLSAMVGAASNIGVKIYVKANKVAYDFSLLGGLINMRSIIDRDTRTLTMLLPNHMAMVQDLRAMDTVRRQMNDSLSAHQSILDSLSQIIPQPTGEHKTIEGLDAERYHAANKTIDLDMWLSGDEKIKAFEVIRDAFLGRGEAAGSEDHTGLQQVFAMMRPIGGKIPVRFETKINGKTFAKGELKSIEEGTPAADLFEIPNAYAIVKADSMRNVQKSRRKGITAPIEE